MNNLNTKKCTLVEKLGIFIETKDNLAPVAARILSYIILTGKQGTTFEDLVTNLCASKSTISTHLNHLQDLKKINYFTKIGDRKKYFIINRNTMIQGISSMVDGWIAEKQLHIEVMEYKKEMNKTLSNENKFDFHYHESFIEFLDGAIASITKLKKIILNTNYQAN